MFPICLVDDSREDLALEERVLRECRIVNPIKLLGGGEACLSFLKSGYGTHGQKPAPLLFIDLAMPGMDGIQLMGAIKQAGLTVSPWLIMVSGMTDLKKVGEGYQLGAKTFLAKPFQAPDVKALLKAYATSIVSRLTAKGYELSWG